MLAELYSCMTRPSRSVQQTCSNAPRRTKLAYVFFVTSCKTDIGSPPSSRLVGLLRLSRDCPRTLPAHGQPVHSGQCTSTSVPAIQTRSATERASTAGQKVRTKMDACLRSSSVAVQW
eukprot:jgi/Ulvmu1/6633/UM003_0271.1